MSGRPMQLGVGVKAIGYTEFGGPEVLRALELLEPHAGPGQVRVGVHAAAVSPADTAARSGWTKRNYPPHTLPGGRYPDPPYVTGWDFCGVLDKAPDGGAIGIGERVIGLALSPMGKVGAHAEYVVTSASWSSGSPEADRPARPRGEEPQIAPLCGRA